MPHITEAQLKSLVAQAQSVATGKRAELAAPERVIVFTQRDLLDADGKVVQERGYRQELYRVDARELIRTSKGEDGTPNYGYHSPEGGAKAAGKAEAEVEENRAAGLEDLPNVGPDLARALEDANFPTIPDVAAASEEDLAAVPGIGSKLAKQIRTGAKKLMADVDSAAAAKAAEGG